MAKIQTETVVLTFNRLVKDSESAPTLLTPETTAALEHVAQELAGQGVVVEIQVA